MSNPAAGTRRIAQPTTTIALAVLFGSSLWFSANGVADGLARAWDVTAADIGLLTSAVQFGFIIGAAALAFTGAADRYSASRIFAVSAVLGAIFNGAFAYGAESLPSAIFLRFLVGVCIAGIYPIGMKLAVRWAPDRAGTAISLLVGMLVLGTALPHGLRWLGADLDWRLVMSTASILALVASWLIWRLGDGPDPAVPPTAATQGRRAGALSVFRLPRFRASAFGYFGHMWELYAFWTLVPMLIQASTLGSAASEASAAEVSALAFLTIAVGLFGCIWGGALSRRIGGARVAALALAVSGACCVGFGLWGEGMPPALALAVLLAWGLTVVADSPQFSALAAQNCPPEAVGGALAVQNCIGFTITLLAIWIATALVETWGTAVALLLAPGPLLGLIGSRLLWLERVKHVQS